MFVSKERNARQPAFFLERGDSQSKRLARVKFGHWALIPGLLFLLCGLRFLDLGADTPIWAKSYSMGDYVDEGYKTLSARNLVLFGQTHWHPLDNYPGWMKASPVTNWSYY